MNIECPCCGDCFEPNEDHLRWESSEDVNLNDSSKIVWEKIPLLRSTWVCNKNDGCNTNIINNNDDDGIKGEKQ